jgi:hypothetical protein
MHTMEVPFVFDNVDGCKSEVGDGPERYALAKNMSDAWVAFARDGNPNHKGLPNWRPFDAQDRETMIFNTECKLVNAPIAKSACSSKVSGKRSKKPWAKKMGRRALRPCAPEPLSVRALKFTVHVQRSLRSKAERCL